MSAIDLRCGDWRDVLADVECDALITDPPYGPRTHEWHDAGVEGVHRESRSDEERRREGGGGPAARRRKLNYGSWQPEDVREFVAAWAPRVRGWFCAMSCSDLMPVWREALDAAGLCTFAPVACVIRAMSVRLSGDGPSSWTIYLNVARPRTPAMKAWGALNGAYVVSRDPGHIGGKPLELMTSIVRDYSRPGDVIVDPCAGLATTGIAAEMLGRRFVGAEVDPDTHAKALARIAAGVQLDMLGGVA